MSSQRTYEWHDQRRPDSYFFYHIKRHRRTHTFFSVLGRLNDCELTFIISRDNFFITNFNFFYAPHEAHQQNININSGFSLYKNKPFFFRVLLMQFLILIAASFLLPELDSRVVCASTDSNVATEKNRQRKKKHPSRNIFRYEYSARDNVFERVLFLLLFLS